MNAIFDRACLARAFAAVSSVVPSRTPKPVLTNVLLTVNGDVKLTATDLDISIEHTVAGVAIREPGKALLPCDRVEQILKTSTEGSLGIETSGDQLLIKSESSSFRLNQGDPAEFPEFSRAPIQSQIEITARDLGRLIRQSIFAVDADNTSNRSALAGVLCCPGDGEITFVATDGRRLAIARSLVSGSVPADESMVIIPVKVLRLIERCLDSPDSVVGISFDQYGITANIGQAQIRARLIEGRFPRYQEILPRGEQTKVTLKVSTFRGLLEQAAIMTSEESRSVDFRFASNELMLSASSSDFGSSLVRASIDWPREEFLIQFDPRYILDCLRVLDPESTITLGLSEPRSQAAIEADGFVYVVMPLTKER